MNEITDTAIVTPDDTTQEVAVITPDNAQITTTIAADTPEQKKLLYKAINSPDYRVADHINEVINLTGYLAHDVMLVNEKTGELEAQPRFVLVNDEGETFQCISQGIKKAIRNLEFVFGPMSKWTTPIPVKVRQIAVAKGSMLDLELA